MKLPASSGFLTYYVLHHGDEVAFLRDGKKGTVYAYSGKLKPMLSFDWPEHQLAFGSAQPGGSERKHFHSEYIA